MSASNRPYHVPAGQQLTIVANTVTSGHVYQVIAALPVTGTTITITKSATEYIGPFATARDYIVVSEGGTLTATVAGVEDDVYGDAGNLTGVAGNLSIIPQGRNMLLRANGQALVFGSLTVNGSYQVDGELRVQAWPT